MTLVLAHRALNHRILNHGSPAGGEVRHLEERVRELELERLRGRKTMEVEILKGALDWARAKNLSICRNRGLPGDTR